MGQRAFFAPAPGARELQKAPIAHASDGILSRDHLVAVDGF